MRYGATVHASKQTRNEAPAASTVTCTYIGSPPPAPPRASTTRSPSPPFSAPLSTTNAPLQSSAAGSTARVSRSQRCSAAVAAPFHWIGCGASCVALSQPAGPPAAEL
eukprot:2058358-Prymnesium_polylepis.1